MSGRLRETQKSYSRNDWFDAGYSWYELPKGMKAQFLLDRHTSDRWHYYHGTVGNGCPICAGYNNDIEQARKEERIIGRREIHIVPIPQCRIHGLKLVDGKCKYCESKE